MLESTIRLRRTIKPAQMNGKVISDETIQFFLELADWAPTHGRTEPWRFIVYANDRMKEFCAEHATLYQQHTPAEKFKTASYDKLKDASAGASHLIIAYMKRGSNPNIPEIEEIAAASAAIQNLLLAVTDHKCASFWSTSGMVHTEILKDHLELGEEDKVLGFLFIGCADEPLKEGKRNIPLAEKIKWVR